MGWGFDVWQSPIEFECEVVGSKVLYHADAESVYRYRRRSPFTVHWTRVTGVVKFRTYDLALELYGQCETIKAKHHLKDQLSRASLSIVLNIAEGSGKPTPNDKRRFYSIALGSLRETQAILQITNNKPTSELAQRLGGHLYRLVHPR